MEDKDALIHRLQNEVKARNDEVYLAATYGKQLVEEKTILTSKIDELLIQNERLEQEKHSLQLDLETQIQTAKSQINEFELQREQTDKLHEKFQANEKEAFHKKIENLRKETLFLKKAQEDLSIENNSLKEQILVLTKQINNFQDQAEKSMCETDKDENQELQAQLNVYMLNNKELQSALSTCQCELELAKKNENHLLKMVQELEDSILEKNTEISAYSEEMKKAKEEIEEMQGEFEILKFDQIDVNKRGNSVFAELDDRRTMVEREYKVLRKKYEQFQKDYETNKKELDRARGQVAILQSQVSREHQQFYIEKLEDSLASARQEVRDLMHKLSKALKLNEEKNPLSQNSKANEYDYLRAMLLLSQKKEKELQAEVMNLKTKNMYDNDKLVTTQHHLYKVKEDLDSANQEISKLKLEIKELQQGIMHKLPEPVFQKPRIEVLDGFKPPSSPNKKTDLLNKSLFNDFPDFDTIPAEIELGDDGFRQVRPSRKSNRFILKEFNKIEVEDEKLVEKSSSEKNELIPKICEKDTGKIEKLSSQKIRTKPSRRRNDDCAQQ